MKKILVALVLGLAIVAAAPAADWSDNGDGTWSLTVTYTVTTQKKQMAEQLRADHNWRHFYDGQERDASEWVGEMLEGFTGTRSSSTVPGIIDKGWRAFLRMWISVSSLLASADGGMTEGLSVSVPDPVTAP